MVAAFRAALPFAVAFVVSLALAISACAARMAVELLPAAVLEGDCRVARDAGRAQPIAWFRPRDPAQAGSLDAWCRSVGPPVILRGTPADDVVFDRLVIASWNTHVGGGRLDRFIGDLRAGKLTGGEPVVHFVLLLQEVFRADAALPPVPRGVEAPAFIGGGIERQAVIDVARRHQLSLYYVPSMRNGAAPQAGALPEDRGNAIVSTLPLDEYAAVELPFAAQRRVAALASVRMRTSSGLRRIRLVSTHLDASLGWRRLWVVGAANHRAAQTAALVSALAQEATAREDATVVGGDFNTIRGASERTYDLMLDAFPQSPDPGPQLSFPSWRWRLDFLFVRLPSQWGASYRVIDEDRYGSDHRPIVGRIELIGDEP